MTNFVLLHGAWHGGWCWKDVADTLQSYGHRTSCPTLPGLAERGHLLSPETGMETFVADVIDHIVGEKLNDVVLVGHSFGGNVATVVADRITNRLNRLIFLDADIAMHGRSTFDLMPPQIVAERLNNLIEHRGVRCMPAPPTEALGLPNTAAATLVAEKLTPHPVRSYEDIVSLRNMSGAGLPGDYIRCIEPDYGMSDDAVELARQIGLTVHDISAGHDAMITHPNELAALLTNAGR